MNNGKLVKDPPCLGTQNHQLSFGHTHGSVVKGAGAGGQQGVGRLVGRPRDLLLCLQSRGVLWALPSGHGVASPSSCP